MEENFQEDSEISDNIEETPQTPTQSPLVMYNDMHTSIFQPFHPILPALHIPQNHHPGYTQLPSSWTNIIPVHPAVATPEHQPLLNGPQSQARREEEKST